MSVEATYVENRSETQRLWAAWYAEAELSLRHAAEYEYGAREPGVLHANAGGIIGPCRSHYLAAARLVGLENELIARLEALDSFDHRTVYTTYFRLADEFAREPHAAQLVLDLEGTTDGRRVLAERWRTWFHKRIEALSMLPWFCQAVVTAAAFPNPDPRGIDAEDTLDRCLPTWQ